MLDKEDMRRMIHALLMRDTHLVLTGFASTAAEAIEAAASFSPALIVLDYFIDEPVTGLEAAPSLRRVAPESKIPSFSAHALSSEHNGRTISTRIYKRTSPRSCRPWHCRSSA